MTGLDGIRKDCMRRSSGVIMGIAGKMRAEMIRACLNMEKNDKRIRED